MSLSIKKRHDRIAVSTKRHTDGQSATELLLQLRRRATCAPHILPHEAAETRAAKYTARIVGTQRVAYQKNTHSTPQQGGFRRWIGGVVARIFQSDRPGEDDTDKKRPPASTLRASGAGEPQVCGNSGEESARRAVRDSTPQHSGV
jgi:hypothetical protein